MEGRCIMMCSGEFHPMEIEIRRGDWVVAVDGGLRYLAECGIRPDFLIGDFDSLEGECADLAAKYREMGKDHFRRLPVVKDDTDTMAAAREGVKRGYREFLIYGGLGRRLDHTIANIQTLTWLLRRGASGWLLDRDTRITVAGPGRFVLPEDFRGTVSLFALDRELSGVTIRGMKYNVENAAVRNDFPVGCSNETLPRTGGEEACIEIGEGTALIVMTEHLINRHH